MICDSTMLQRRWFGFALIDSLDGSRRCAIVLAGDGRPPPASSICGQSFFFIVLRPSLSFESARLSRSFRDLRLECYQRSLGNQKQPFCVARRKVYALNQNGVGVPSFDSAISECGVPVSKTCRLIQANVTQKAKNRRGQRSFASFSD